MKKVLLIFAAAALALGFRAAEPFEGEHVKESGTTYVHDALEPYVKSGELPGAISILYKDGVQETCCIGFADVATGRPITLDSPFMQCSQTKGFCGVTVAKLVEEGKLSLDDPVSKYLPEFKELWILTEQTGDTKTLKKAKNELTIRMCLNHTGGFPFEICAKRPDIRGGGWSGGAPLRQTATIAAASPIMFEPGTKEMYSNTGIDIAAAVVAEVTGMKWEDYLKKEILDPLGMTSSTFVPTDEQLSRKIELYQYVEGKPAVYVSENGNQQRPYNDSHVFASAGAGLWTTARDQLKFYKMLMNLGMGDNGVRVLKEETVKNLLAVSSRPKGMGGYSLGLAAPEVDGENEWFGHGGAWGTHCIVNWHKRQLKLWVIQSNGGPQPWGTALAKAQQDFLDSEFATKDIDAYTGRLK
ncbi:MAG: beta-lactamase family protein [Bacteroidales bacterium]|nr:beta-lactamase family protein [Bacteroidales bacterium]